MATRNLRSGGNPPAELSNNSSRLPIVARNRFAVLMADPSQPMSSAEGRAIEAARRLQEIEDENARERIAQDIIAQDEPKAMAERMAEATQARQIAKQEQLIQQGLEILYTQGDEFDFTSTEISDLGLNAESFEQLMERYIAKPTKDIQLSKGASSVNLTADVIRLKGNINAESAEAFQTMSDLKGKQWVAEIHELINDEAEFTIQGWLEANNTDANYNIPVGWENWQKRWNHATLAKFVTMVWGRNRAPQTTMVDEIMKFDLGVDKDIINVASEEGTLVKLNIILKKFPNEAKDPQKQKVLCQILDKKMPTGHEIRTDMRNMPPPADTKQWISNYRKARAAARITISKSRRYLALSNASISKIGSKRLSNIDPWSTKTDFNDNDLEQNNRVFRKKQKRHRAKAEGREIDWSETRCKGCGKTGHLLPACWQSKGETEHSDRNKEDKPFHQNTKGN
jgi:hypothetical protein